MNTKKKGLMHYIIRRTHYVTFISGTELNDHSQLRHAHRNASCVFSVLTVGQTVH